MTVIGVPFIEESDNKVCPLVGSDGVGLFGFDALDELKMAAGEFVTKVTVDLLCVADVALRNEREDVVLHPGLLQEVKPSHHSFVRTPPGGIRSAEIVQFGGPINADPEQELLLRKEGRERRSDEGRIGLDTILNGGSRTSVTLLQGHELAVEGFAHQEGFAALKGKGVHRKGKRKITPHKAGQRSFIHPVNGLLGVECRLLKVKTIRTPQIAVCACRFHQE